MAFGDFVALKQRVSIEQTAVLLGLNTKQSAQGGLSKLQGRRRACDRHHAGERNCSIASPARRAVMQSSWFATSKASVKKDAAALISAERSHGTARLLH
jgi:hypothetical protein